MSYEQQREPDQHPGYGRDHPPQRMIFDGKRMRKPVQRRTVDYNSVMMQYLEVKLYTFMNPTRDDSLFEK